MVEKIRVHVRLEQVKWMFNEQSITDAKYIYIYTMVGTTKFILNSKFSKIFFLYIEQGNQSTDHRFLSGFLVLFEASNKERMFDGFFFSRKNLTLTMISHKLCQFLLLFYIQTDHCTYERVPKKMNRFFHSELLPCGNLAASDDFLFIYSRRRIPNSIIDTPNPEIFPPL